VGNSVADSGNGSGDGSGSGAVDVSGEDSGVGGVGGDCAADSAGDVADVLLAGGQELPEALVRGDRESPLDHLPALSERELPQLLPTSDAREVDSSALLSAVQWHLRR